MRLRRGAAVLPLLVLLTACGGGEPESDLPTVGTDAPSTASPTEAETSDPAQDATLDPADVETIKDVYARYWDAAVTARNTPEANAALFEGLVLPEHIEGEIKTAREYIERGVHQSGGPVVTAVEVTAQDGDTAVVSACIDGSQWPLIVDGAPLPISERLKEPLLSTREAHYVDGRWLLGSGDVDAEGTTLTC